MIQAISRVALQLWIVLFLVFFGAEVIHLEPGLRILTQVLFGAPLVAWAALTIRGPVDRLDAAVIGSLVLYAVVAVLGRDRTEGLGTLGLVTAYAAWFLVIRRLANADLRRAVVLGGATGMAVTLAINAYLLLEEKASLLARFGAAPFEGVNTFPWESVNALPVLVLLAIPFVAWLEPRPLRSALGTVVAGSALVVVPLSMGRAGWLGLGLVVLLVVGWWARTRMPRGRQLVVGGLATIGAVAALVVGAPRFVTALEESGRLLLWQQGMNLVGRSPLIGSGPGVYSWVRLEVPPAEADLVAVRLLHNVPLQTAADGGLLLVLGMLLAIAAWIAVVIRRSTWSSSDRLGLAALIGFGVALSLDDFSYLPAITAAAVTVAGLLTPILPNARPGGHGWLLPAALGVGALISLPGVIGIDLARSASQEGRTAMVEDRPADAVAAFQRATAAHSESGGAWLGLGMALAYADEPGAAADAYRRATEAAPGDPRGHAALAVLVPDGVIQSLQDAAERTTGDPAHAVQLGTELAAIGNVDDGTHAWAQALALRPSLLSALPFDEAGLSRDAVMTEARSILVSGLHPAAFENQTALWDIGLGVGELPAGAGAAWQAVVAARSGDFDLASELADAAVADAPWVARGYQARAAVAAFACDRSTEAAALALERLARGAYQPPAPEPQARREFIYREASLGPSQPPDATLDSTSVRWPWSLVDRPECP